MHTIYSDQVHLPLNPSKMSLYIPPPNSCCLMFLKELIDWLSFITPSPVSTICMCMGVGLPTEAWATNLFGPHP